MSRLPTAEELDALLGRTEPPDPLVMAHRLADNLRAIRRQYGGAKIQILGPYTNK